MSAGWGSEAEQLSDSKPACDNDPRDAFRIVLVSLAGRINREQQRVIKYLQEEVEVLREQLECLDRMTLVGEESLRRAVAQFCEHYHRERNHQGLENRIIRPDFSLGGEGEVQCRERLGGLLRFYHQDAA